MCRASFRHEYEASESNLVRRDQQSQWECPYPALATKYYKQTDCSLSFLRLNPKVLLDPGILGLQLGAAFSTSQWPPGGSKVQVMSVFHQAVSACRKSAEKVD